MRFPALIAVCVLGLAACGQPKVDTHIPQPPRTTLSPEPGPFSDHVTVTLTADLPSTVYVTTDGSDPSKEGTGRKSGASPLAVELSATTTLRYCAVSDADDVAETPGTAVYTRAGGVPGVITGEVIFATVAVSKKVAVALDNDAPVELGTPAAAGALPFKFDKVADGTHRLRAWSDRNGDGNYTPVLDISSASVGVEIDSKDPFKASAEGVKLYLAASEDGYCTLAGNVSFTKPPVGQSLSIAALSGSALSQGADPAALLQQLQNGYQVFTNQQDTQYSYAITNLEPGDYIPVAILTGIGAGGAALNFQGRPFPLLHCGAGATSVRDFTFGGITLSGSATFTPPANAAGFVYGVVAAKTLNTNFTSPDVGTFQAVLMPTVFTAGTAQGTLTGGFGAVALRGNGAHWDMRAFPSTDSQNPLVAALPWLLPSIAGGSGAPAQASFTAQSADVTQDFTF